MPVHLRVLPVVAGHPGAAGAAAGFARPPASACWTAGVRQFKFVDRTFNLNLDTSRTILEFLLERHRPGHFFHFEMIPDRLPAALREVIARFPPGRAPIRGGRADVQRGGCGADLSRRQNYERLEDNFRFLRRQTGVHIHADLIAGLPGESLESFAAGFDRLMALGPQEIQVGILEAAARHAHRPARRGMADGV